MQKHWLLQDIHEEALSWVNQQLALKGLDPIQELEPVREMAWSLVAKVNHEQGVWYFKSLPAYFAQELPLSEYLSDVSPLVARFAAMDQARRFLLIEDAGPMLRERYEQKLDPVCWFEALEQYAQLQIELMDSEKLQTFQLPDRRLHKLPELISPVLSDLMPFNGEGKDEQLREADLEIVQTAFRQWDEIISPLHQHGIGNTVNHGDFHDGNFAYTDRPIIFDWGDASITHPFMSLRSSFISIERRFGYTEHSPELEPFIAAYLKPWQKFAKYEDLRHMFTQAQRVWALVSFLSWRWALQNQSDERATKYNYALPALIREFADAASR